MRKVLVLSLLAFSAHQGASAAVATPMSAVHLYSACSDAQSSGYARGFCEGAIDALYSSMQDWCVPSAVTHGEVKRHVKDELLRSTPPSGLSAFEFVSRAVRRKWPCS